MYARMYVRMYLWRTLQVVAVELGGWWQWTLQVVCMVAVDSPGGSGLGLVAVELGGWWQWTLQVVWWQWTLQVVAVELSGCGWREHYSNKVKLLVLLYCNLSNGGNGGVDRFDGRLFFVWFAVWFAGFCWSIGRLFFVWFVCLRAVGLYAHPHPNPHMI